MTLIDEFTRECLAIRVARRINSFGVIETMADVMLERGVPEHIRSDNGAEMTAKIVRSWFAKLGAKTLYIEPGSPWENGYCESFNGKAARRMPERGNLLQPEGSQHRHRAMAQALQHDQTALIAELPTAGAADIIAPNASSGSERSDAVVSIPLVQNIRQVTAGLRESRVRVPALTAQGVDRLATTSMRWRDRPRRRSFVSALSTPLAMCSSANASQRAWTSGETDCFAMARHAA